jgi:hypothetical protein
MGSSCDDVATASGLLGRPMDMSLTVLSMFDTNFIYFSVTIDFHVAPGLASPHIPSL